MAAGMISINSFRIEILDVMISGMTGHSIEPRSMDELRAQLLSHYSEEPTRVGTSLALDASDPMGIRSREGLNPSTSSLIRSRRPRSRARTAATRIGPA